MTIKIAPLFFVGTKNKEHFYNFIFINFWVKSELRGFLQSLKRLKLKKLKLKNCLKEARYKMEMKIEQL